MIPWDCCRTCLSNKNLNSIFSQNDAKEYLEMVYNATGVKITSKDELPKQICMECTEFIQISSKFREKCQETQKIFYKHLKNQLHDFDVGLKLETNCNMKQDNCRYSENVEINITELKQEDAERNNDLVKTVNFENINLFDDVPDTLTDDSNPPQNTDQHFAHSNITELTKTIDNKTNETLTETKKTKVRLKTPKKESKTSKRQLENELRDKKIKNLNDKSDGLVDCDKKIAKSTKEEVICEVCSKVLKSKLSVRNHMKIHTGFEIVCEHCGKKFITKRLLLMHCKARHGYEKTDKCSYCEYRGCNKEQVQVHERIHTGERPFVCKQCNASFFRNSCYLQHVAIHLPEKTVQCEQCPAKFQTVTLMKIHANRHRVAQLYSYKCYVCASVFARKRNVLRHLRRTHAVAEPTQIIERIAK